MWRYDYQNKPANSPIRDCSNQTGRDFKGCEMNEIFGYGAPLRKPSNEPLRGFFRLIAAVLGLDSWGRSR